MVRVGPNGVVNVYSILVVWMSEVADLVVVWSGYEMSLTDAKGQTNRQ